MPTNYSKIRRHFPQRFEKVKWNVITLSRLPTVRPNEARGGTKYWKKIRTLLKHLKTNWRPVKTSQSHVIKCVGVTKKRKIFIKLSRFNAPTHALKKIWHCLQRKLTVWKTSDKCVKNEMSTAWKAIEKAHLIEEQASPFLTRDSIKPSIAFPYP